MTALVEVEPARDVQPDAWPSGTLTGRGSADQALVRLHRQAGTGRSPLAVVTGPAGVGRTTLLRRHLARHGGSDPVVWLTCERDERNVPFAAAEVVLGESVEPDACERQVGRLLLDRLRGRTPGDGWGDGSVRTVVVDDLQWMDPRSFRALRFALRRLHEPGHLTVLSQRTGSRHAADLESVAPASTTSIGLAPFDEEEVRELVRLRTAMEVSTSAAGRIMRVTAGLPWVVAPLVDELGASGADVARLQPRVVVPAARRLLDSLELATRGLVEAAAVVGSTAPSHVLAAIGHELGTDPDVAGAAVAEALAAGLIEEDHGRVVVVCPMVALAVRESMSAARRESLRERARRSRLTSPVRAAAGAVPTAAAVPPPVPAVPAPSASASPPLTPQEATVAGFVRRGLTNKEIADEMSLTPKAIEYHLTRIFSKVGVRNRRELRRQSVGVVPDPSNAGSALSTWVSAWR